MPAAHQSQPDLRSVVASQLRAAKPGEAKSIARIVAEVRAALPKRRLNDAELIHLISEGARQQGFPLARQ